MLCLAVEIESTRCSKYGSRCIGLAWNLKALVVDVTTAVGLSVAIARLLFRYSENVSRRSKRSLPGDF